MKKLLVCIAVFCGLIEPAVAESQWPGRIEIVAVKSRTLTGEEFLVGGTQGHEVLLAGELRLPFGATGKVPAVVMIHGSGGVGATTDYWARAFNETGIAAFMLDSFSGRGIVSTAEDQDQLASVAMIVDAYRALDMLAAHPRIRADRIAIMGFSKGAVAGVYSAMDRFRKSYGSETNRFAAHIGFYTPCNVAYDGDTSLAPVPIRMFHGMSDDYVNIVPCRDYVARLKSAGADVSLTEYPDSQHGFDSPTSPRILALPLAQSTRNCRLKEASGGHILNAVSGEPYTIKTDPCVAIGAHIGHNAEATDAARIAVLKFAKDVLAN